MKLSVSYQNRLKRRQIFGLLCSKANHPEVFKIRQNRNKTPNLVTLSRLVIIETIEYSLPYFTVQLTSCLTGLNLTRQVSRISLPTINQKWLALNKIID